MFAAQDGHEQVGSIVCPVFARVVCAMHTRVHPFASHHHEQVARELLKAGAAVDAIENKQWTALMFAAQGGHAQVGGSRVFSIA